MHALPAKVVVQFDLPSQNRLTPCLLRIRARERSEMPDVVSKSDEPVRSPSHRDRVFLRIRVHDARTDSPYARHTMRQHACGIFRAGAAPSSRLAASRACLCADTRCVRPTSAAHVTSIRAPASRSFPQSHHAMTCAISFGAESKAFHGALLASAGCTSFVATVGGVFFPRRPVHAEPLTSLSPPPSHPVDSHAPLDAWTLDVRRPPRPRLPIAPRERTTRSRSEMPSLDRDLSPFVPRFRRRRIPLAGCSSPLPGDAP